MRQRWIRPLCAFFSCLSLHQVVFAAEASKLPTTSKPSEGEGAESEIDDPDSELDDPSDSFPDNDKSSTERITNAGSVQIGTSFRKGLGLDLRLGLHQDENKLIELRVARFKGEKLSNFDEVNIDTILVQGKFFMGNSLFMAIATGWSQLLAKDEELLVVGGLEGVPFKYEGSINQFLLTLSMGNQWQFESWTAGFDWLNLYMPFSASKADSKGDFSMVGGEIRRLNNEQNLKSEAWEVDYGVSLYLGYIW